ncbi:hypothetical protein WJX73_008747 [Symbiochloris irregularis]|uniref:Uncharacterized protein n=1 Tax=Symbiochloris irregularis TaxID=706552 RepID=A0AAW1P1C6_9CHLO
MPPQSSAPNPAAFFDSSDDAVTRTRLDSLLRYASMAPQPSLASAVLDPTKKYGVLGSRSPSALSNPDEFEAAQNETQLFLCGRPPQLMGLPAALESPIFGRVIDNASTIRPTRADCQAAGQLQSAVDEGCKLEQTLPGRLLGIVRQHLGPPAFDRFAPAGNLANAQTDGTWADPDRKWAAAWMQIRRTVGALPSDPWLQLQACFYVYVNQEHHKRAGDYHWPALGLDISPPIIQLSALFFSDRPHCEVLGFPYSASNRLNSQRPMSDALSRLLAAWKLGSQQCKAEAEAWLSGSHPPILQGAAFAPYPLRNPDQ